MNRTQHNLVLPAPVRPPLQPILCEKKFTWASEFRHLASSRFLTICWWPFFLIRQFSFNRTPLIRSCSQLPGFTDLWKTIRKSSFAYNSLLLGVLPFRKSSVTSLADTITLALFFGDEFIDGLADSAGKDRIRKLIRDHPEQFYMQPVVVDGRIKLQYPFDLYSMLPDILSLENKRYGITYATFYNLMLHFLDLINCKLSELSQQKANGAALKIAETCNACFNSFLHDVNSCTPGAGPVHPEEVLKFHEMKTGAMQTHLLELRCLLLDKPEVMKNVQTPGWLDIMRVVQIYDDIQDAIIDDGVQDNLVLSVAAYYFPKEWQWFTLNKKNLTGNKSLLLSAFMPYTMEYCHALAAGKIKTMTWEQQKIMHYLLLKTKYRLYLAPGKQENASVSSLYQLYTLVQKKMIANEPTQVKSFIVDTCMHVPMLRKKILQNLDLLTRYRLRYNLFTLQPEMKSELFDRAMKR